MERPSAVDRLYVELHWPVAGRTLTSASFTKTRSTRGVAAKSGFPPLFGTARPGIRWNDTPVLPWDGSPCAPMWGIRVAEAENRRRRRGFAEMENGRRSRGQGDGLVTQAVCHHWSVALGGSGSSWIAMAATRASTNRTAVTVRPGRCRR